MSSNLFLSFQFLKKALPSAAAPSAPPPPSVNGKSVLFVCSRAPLRTRVIGFIRHLPVLGRHLFLRWLAEKLELGKGVGPLDFLLVPGLFLGHRVTVCIPGLVVLSGKQPLRLIYRSC